MGTVFFFTEYYFLNQIHKEQIALNQNIVGKLVNRFPEKEIDIVKLTINKDKKVWQNKGDKILKKYGYDMNTKMLEDDIFKENFYKFITSSFIAIVLAIIINFILMLYIMNFFTSKLENFSYNIDKIMDGDFSVISCVCREGVLSRISTQFEQMSKRLNASLKKLQKEKESVKALVTDISHQLKTPLSSIKMFNSFLMEEDIEDKDRIEFLNRSEKSIEKLEWLTDSLVKLSRLEIGMISLKKEKGNINETIYEVVNELYLKAFKKNIDISFEGKNNCFINYDLKWTKEAIFNVLDNAIKYTKEDGEINIVLKKLEFYIEIDIKDNGVGICEEDIQRIFKRFERGDSKFIRESEGSGVGLYLTRKILEKQGGCITVTSKEGLGTTFNLFLQNC
ncbi:HAMP domain-containing sensor histidine kinase [Clostridium oceanicum]|uniref:histidine kinase n=1 Tax=Clostridium oceanicum TaxID=1543 RepID=A0ABN1JE09_9CLOT